MISRFLTGMFGIFMSVFFPVWVDFHGKNKATVWLTLLQVGSPLGIFLGYAITAVAVDKFTPESVILILLFKNTYIYIYIYIIIYMLISIFCR